MKLFELVDRWHQRRILLKLIAKKEKEIKYMHKLLGYIPDLEPDRSKHSGLVEYFLRDEPKKLEEIKLYKTKLRQLL